MATEQVTITISASDGLGVRFANDGIPHEGLTQVDLFATQEAAPVVGTAQTPTEAAEAPPEAAKPAPWDIAGVAGNKGLNLPLSPALHAKMVWLTQNLPQMSLQKLAKQGTAELVDRLIAEHYKPCG